MAKFFQTMSNVPKVSENTIRMTQALAQFANAGGMAGSAASNLNSRINMLSFSMGILKGPIGKATNGLKSFGRQILSSMGIYLGIYGAVRGIKKSLEIASDLTEVQNVVDVTFSDMAYKVEEFAEISIEKFGMSELALKQYASRFQAMGTAMGIDPRLIKDANSLLNKQTDGYVGLSDSMSDVSLNLTKLTADMASLYNVEQKAVAEDLEAIFTGQTRPLRTYGLDLTQATLAEWALKNGLDANIKSMSQAEKTMLRYQYVLANTKAAQGDFERTQYTWANQVRILKQNFEQLAVVIGGTLVNAFKPIVIAVNQAMGGIIAFAKTISNALGKIFGWTYEEGGGGLAQDFGGAADFADDLAGSTGKAAKNIDKMKAGLRAFDELKTISIPGEDGGAGGGGGGGGGGAGGAGEAGGGWVKGESILKQFESDIDSLYGLGEHIGKVLTEVMNNIEWGSIYEKARNFGSGLASFLNGLISPKLFGEVGTSIAGALNTALHFLDSFGTDFDWVNFGNSVAAGINKFFSDFDFELLAHTINTWAEGLLDFVITSLQKVEWYNIGTKIGEFLDDINFLKIGAKFVKAIWEAINAAFKTYKGAFDTAPIETALISLASFSGALMLLHTSIFGKILGSAKNVGTAILSIGKAFGKLAISVKNNGLSGITTALRDWGKSLSSVQRGALTAATAFVEFLAIKTIVHDLKDGTGSVLTNLLELGGVAVAASAVMYAALGPAGLAVAAVTGLIAAIAGVSEANQEHVEHLFDEFEDKIPKNTENLKKATEEVEKLSDKSNEYISGAQADANELGNLADAYFKLADKTSLTKDEQEKLREYAKQLKDEIPLLGGAIDGVTGKYTTQRKEIEKLIEMQKRQIMADAYKKATSEYAENLAKVNVELALATKSHDENAKSLERLNEIRKDYDLRDETAFLEKYGEELKDLGAEIGKNDTVLSALDRTEQFWATHLHESEDAMNQASEAVSKADEELDALNETAEKNLNELDKLKKGSEEYQQALKNLKTDLNNLDLTLSDDFVSDLAENGFDTSGLKSYFDSISQGVAAEASELQRMFSEMGMELPDTLANALEGKDAETQAEAVKMIMAMKSGVELEKPHLLKLLNDLGLEIPEGLITNFTNAKPELQAKIIEYLAMIDQGYGLSAPAIKNLFHDFGIDLPDELTKTISSKEPEAQKAAIEIIGAIEEAAKQKGVDAKTIYATLGTNTINELIGSVNGLSEDTKKAALDLIGQLLTAADDQRDPIISKLKELGIEFDESFIDGISDPAETKKVETTAEAVPGNAVGAIDSDKFHEDMEKKGKHGLEGFIKGLGDSTLVRSLKETAGGLMNIVDSTLRSTGKIKSPSRLTMKLGEYTTQGFNVGLKSEMGETYSIVADWYKTIASFKPPQLNSFEAKDLVANVNYSIGKFPEPDIAKTSSNVQMDISAAMSARENEIRQQNRLLQEQNELLRAIYEKPTLSDDDVFNSTRRGQQKYQSRTWKTGWAGVD